MRRLLALTLLIVTHGCATEAESLDPDPRVGADIFLPPAVDFGALDALAVDGRVQDAMALDGAALDGAALDALGADAALPDAEADSVADSALTADLGGDTDAEITDLGPDVGGSDVGPDAGPVPLRGPGVVLFVGAGMGPDHLKGASLLAHGAAGRLRIEQLAVDGWLTTASLSGTADSAAAATALATGVATLAGQVGRDEVGAVLTPLAAVARAAGGRVGLVTSGSLADVTLAAFVTAPLGDEPAVLAAAIAQAAPDWLLGGGADDFAAVAGGLEADDYQRVRTAAALAAVDPSRPVLGLFAPGPMEAEADRQPGSTQPTLAVMTRAGLDALGSDGAPFLLVVEAAGIDAASRAGDLRIALTETLALDEAVAEAADWSRGRDDVAVVVTGDHETGDLVVEGGMGIGVLPAARFGSIAPSNRRIRVFSGGLADPPFGVDRDLRWVHSVVQAHLQGVRAVPPPTQLIPDGHLDELRFRPATQRAESGFGVGFNQLDALHVDADERALAVGLSGLFERDSNAVVLLIDVDFGANTGLASLVGATQDREGRLDAILASAQIAAPPVEGFGADFALVVHGAAFRSALEMEDDAGLRGLRPPYGAVDDLGWTPVAISIAEQSRVGVGPVPAPLRRGIETRIPWTTLYPDGGGRAPADAELAFVAWLLNDTGEFASNQSLPSLAADAVNPGDVIVTPSGVVVFDLDGEAPVVQP